MNKVMIVGTRGDYKVRFIVNGAVAGDIPVTAEMILSLVEDAMVVLRSLLAEERETYVKKSKAQSQKAGPGSDQGV